MSLTQLLDRNRHCYGDRIALVDDYREITWAQLGERVRAIAADLLKLGLRHGDRVVVLARDRIEVFEAYFALASLGAAFVPVDPELAWVEVANVIAMARATAVIGEGGTQARLRDLNVPVVLDLDGPLFGPEVPPSVDGPLPDVRPDDIVAIMLTSATTGPAKGVVWDHRGLTQVCLSWLAAAEPSDDMTFISCSPVFHGSLAMSFAYMTAGACVVLTPGSNPAAVLRAVERHRVTHVWIVPEMLRHLARAVAGERADTTSLREIIYGSAPMSWDLYREAAETLRCSFRQAYGVTEAGGHVAMLAPSDHPRAGELPDRSGAIAAGRPLPAVCVEIQTTTGTESRHGEFGEVCVRSDSLMRGYWDDPWATAEVTRGGWLRTGDLGRIDEHGYLWLSGRIIDVIKRDGCDVHPAEIERVLRSHVGVADTAVVGRSDPAGGEVPVAYVVPADVSDRPTMDDLIRLVDTKLPTHQRPIVINFLEDLPRNRSGKVLRKILREMAVERA
jgi:acyl-CoA synthetase (AMP-forming)/AMP-acid ligase II